MTIDELLINIKEQLRGCSGYVFIDRALSELGDAMKKRPNFSTVAFKKWFHDKNVSFRNNPLAFLSKCGLEDINNGVFDKQVIKSINLNPMIRDMKQRGVEVSEEDMALVETIELFILNNDKMTAEELRNWNINAINYVVKSDDKTTTNLISMFERSKSMKALQLPMSKLREQAEKRLKDWGDLVKECDGNRKESETEEYEYLYKKEIPSIDTKTI